MENQNNYEIIPVFGIMLDAVSVPRAVEISKSYVSNDYFNFILLASAELALESEESENVVRFAKTADLVLPGDHILEKVAEQEMDSNYQMEFLDGLLAVLEDKQGHLCVLCDDESQCEQAVVFLNEDYPGLKVDTAVFGDIGEEEMEALVNQINGYVPDMVLPLVSMEKQQSLLLTHRETLSTKLYISSEALSHYIFQEEKEEASLIKRFLKAFHIKEVAVESVFWERFGGNSQN